MGCAGELTLALLLCSLAHEGGHHVAALCFGERLHFRFAWGRFCVPRLVWTMPEMERREQRVVALAGFWTEAVVAGVLNACGWAWMALAFAAHFLAYPFYAGDASDFRWV